jgi:predicted HAD superfamily hydrolase
MDAAREAGKTVILITDMYMHAEHVADLLARLGIAAERYDRLFSSADLKVSKASGRIFAHVEAALGREPEAFLHLGDSLRGDFANPRRRGWAAQHLPVGPAALALRQADHARTAADLEARHGFCPDIAPPH